MAKAKAASAAPVMPDPDLYDGESLAEETVLDRPVPVAPPVPKHSPKVVELAQEFGMTDAEIEGYEPKALADLLYHQSRLLARQARAERQVQTVKQAAAESIAPKPAPPADDLGIDESQYDPNIIGILKRQQAEIRSLKGEHSQFVDRVNQQQSQNNADVFDAAFEALGPDYVPYLGDKLGREMTVQDIEFQRRIHLIQMAKIDPNNMPPPRVVAKLIRQQAEGLFGPLVKAKLPTAPVQKVGYEEFLGLKAGEPAKPDRKLYRGPDGRILPNSVVEAIQKDAEAVQPWATPTARPTQRSVREEPNGKAKAIKSVAAQLAEMENNPFEDGGGGDSGYVAPDDFPV